MISVYISNENISILAGDAKYGLFNINEYYQGKTPENSIINGVITDATALKNEIKEIWKTNKLPTKGVNLVIDNGVVIGKVMRVPLVSPSKILRFVRRELSTPDLEVMIYDYTVISDSSDKILKNERKKEGMDIYGCAASKETLDGYVSLFEESGIKLSSINLSINSVIKLSNFMNSLSKKTYIIIALDGNSAASYLFRKGAYSVSNKHRFTYDRGTMQSYMEITQIISSLIQFNASQSNESSVEDVYLCGMYEDEAEDLVDYIKQGLGIKAGKLPQYPSEFLVSKKKASNYELSNNIYLSGNLI